MAAGAGGGAAVGGAGAGDAKNRGGLPPAANHAIHAVNIGFGPLVHIAGLVEGAVGADRADVGADVREAAVSSNGVVRAVGRGQRSRWIVADGDRVALCRVIPVSGIGPPALVLGGLLPLVLAGVED